MFSTKKSRIPSVSNSLDPDQTHAEPSGSGVEFLTCEGWVNGLSLIGGTVLCP